MSYEYDVMRPHVSSDQTETRHVSPAQSSMSADLEYLMLKQFDTDTYHVSVS